MSVSFVNDSRNGSTQRGSWQNRPSSGRDSQLSVRPRSEGSNVTKGSRYRHDESLMSKETSHSASSDVANSQFSSKDSTAIDRKEKHSDVRVLPPWVLSFDEDERHELEEAEAQGHLLPRSPHVLHRATHNYMPAPKENAVRGRIFDHKRERSPVTLSTPFESSASKWHKFMVASFGNHHPEGGHVVDHPWIEQHMPDLEKPASTEFDDDVAQQDKRFLLFTAAGRQLLRTKIRRIVLRNPIFPLIVRLTVLTFSTLALGLAAWLESKSSENPCCVHRTSTRLAIAFDSAAILYILYITFDEYNSKPLGLRSPSAKLRLIFLDLFFIAFNSANLGLAFETLGRDSDCPVAEDIANSGCPQSVKQRKETLAAVLFLALLAWIVAFAISAMRIVERVSRAGQ